MVLRKIFRGIIYHGQIIRKTHQPLRQKHPAPRCQAQSKRSNKPRKKAAVRGKDKCPMHGGVSTGPRTAKGRNRFAEARTVHGWETRATRDYRTRKFREMKALVSFSDGTS